MALKESVRKAARDKLYTKHYGMKLNTNTDADVIAWLDKQPSIQGAIKAAVRAQIEKENEKCSS